MTAMENEAEIEPDRAGSLFLDTNILVYAAALGAPLHRQASEEIQRLHESGQELWVSRQILREYLATLSRPQTFSLPLPARVLADDVRYFLRTFKVAEEGPAVTERLLELIEKKEIGGKQIHDANVVATMLSNGISDLLTNNAADFARFSDVIRVIPLKAEQP